MTSDSWQPITTLKPERGELPPVQMQFPDETTEYLADWKGLLYLVARWLIDGGYIIRPNCPVDHYGTIVHFKPNHRHGQPMSNPSRVGDLYVELNDASPARVVRNAEFLVKRWAPELLQRFSTRQ